MQVNFLTHGTNSQYNGLNKKSQSQAYTYRLSGSMIPHNLQGALCAWNLKKSPICVLKVRRENLGILNSVRPYCTYTC